MPIHIMQWNKNEDEIELLNEKSYKKLTYSKFVTDIFFTSQCNQIEAIELENKCNTQEKVIETTSLVFSWKKTSIFAFMVFSNVINYWTLIESFNLAIEINMNVGILTCLLVVKTAITSLLFFVIFNQKLNWNDIIGVFILMFSIIFICLKIDIMWILHLDDSCPNGLESSNSVIIIDNTENEFWIRASSVILMIVTVLLFTTGSIAI